MNKNEPYYNRPAVVMGQYQLRVILMNMQ